jgi:hypothetical protein
VRDGAGVPVSAEEPLLKPFLTKIKRDRQATERAAAVAAAVEAASAAAAAEAADTAPAPPERSSSPRRKKALRSSNNNSAAGVASASTASLPPYDLTSMIEELRMSQVTANIKSDLDRAMAGINARAAAITTEGGASAPVARAAAPPFISVPLAPAPVHPEHATAPPEEGMPPASPPAVAPAAPSAPIAPALALHPTHTTPATHGEQPPMLVYAHHHGAPMGVPPLQPLYTYPTYPPAPPHHHHHQAQAYYIEGPPPAAYYVDGPRLPPPPSYLAHNVAQRPAPAPTAHVEYASQMLSVSMSTRPRQLRSVIRR